MRNMISVRRESDVARQAGNASRAARTAASTSSTDAKSTVRAWRPVAGSKTGPDRPEAPATSRPPIQWLTRSPAPADAESARSITCVIRALPSAKWPR